MRQHLQQFRGFAAVRQQQAHILRCHDPEIPVQSIGGIEEQGHQADRGKGRGDFAGHDAAFANTSDHQLGFAISTTFQQCQSCLHLFAAESLSGGGDGGGFLLQAAGESGQREDP